MASTHTNTALTPADRHHHYSRHFCCDHNHLYTCISPLGVHHSPIESTTNTNNITTVNHPQRHNEHDSPPPHMPTHLHTHAFISTLALHFQLLTPSIHNRTSTLTRHCSTNSVTSATRLGKTNHDGSIALQRGPTRSTNCRRCQQAHPSNGWPSSSRRQAGSVVGVVAARNLLHRRMTQQRQQQPSYRPLPLGRRRSHPSLMSPMSMQDRCCPQRPVGRSRLDVTAWCGAPLLTFLYRLVLVFGWTKRRREGHTARNDARVSG
jgi:hypothetical protein